MVTSNLMRSIRKMIMRHSKDHTDPSIYVTCQWQRCAGVSICYLWYRWLVALFTLSVAITSFLSPERGEVLRGPDQEVLPIVYWKWFIYLTNWGYTLVVVHSVMALILLQTNFINRLSKSNIRDDDMYIDVELDLCRAREKLTSEAGEDDTASACGWSRFICCFYRVLHAAATGLAFLITTVYWTLIYDPKIHAIDAVNVLIHICNSFVMLIEIFLVRHRIHPLDVLGAIFVALVYAVFSALYHWGGGTDRFGRHFIYPALDWSNVNRAVLFSAGCGGGIIAAHAALLLLQFARRRAYRHFFARGSLNLETE